jgi:hypothetical protein
MATRGARAQLALDAQVGDVDQFDVGLVVDLVIPGGLVPSGEKNSGSEITHGCRTFDLALRRRKSGRPLARSDTISGVRRPVALIGSHEIGKADLSGTAQKNRRRAGWSDPIRDVQALCPMSRGRPRCSLSQYRASERGIVKLALEPAGCPASLHPHTVSSSRTVRC